MKYAIVYDYCFLFVCFLYLGNLSQGVSQRLIFHVSDAEDHYYDFFLGGWGGGGWVLFFDSL